MSRLHAVPGSATPYRLVVVSAGMSEQSTSALLAGMLRDAALAAHGLTGLTEQQRDEAAATLEQCLADAGLERPALTDLATGHPAVDAVPATPQADVAAAVRADVLAHEVLPALAVTLGVAEEPRHPHGDRQEEPRHHPDRRRRRRPAARRRHPGGARQRPRPARRHRAREDVSRRAYRPPLRLGPRRRCPAGTALAA